MVFGFVLGVVLDSFCFGYGLVMAWFWDGFGLVLAWCWYGFGVFLAWFRRSYASVTAQLSLAFGLSLVWFRPGFDSGLGCFWRGCFLKFLFRFGLDLEERTPTMIHTRAQSTSTHWSFGLNTHTLTFLEISNRIVEESGLYQTDTRTLYKDLVQEPEEVFINLRAVGAD